MKQAQPALVEKKSREEQQRGRINERDQYSGALISVGLDLIAGSRLQIVADGGEQQRERIREVVACVGNQREAAGADSGDRLENDESDGEGQRDEQDAPLARGMRMTVVMSHYLYRTRYNEETHMADDKLYKAEYQGSGTFIISKPKRKSGKLRQSRLKKPQRGARK